MPFKEDIQMDNKILREKFVEYMDASQKRHNAKMAIEDAEFKISQNKSKLVSQKIDKSFFMYLKRVFPLMIVGSVAWVIILFISALTSSDGSFDIGAMILPVGFAVVLATIFIILWIKKKPGQKTADRNLGRLTNERKATLQEIKRLEEEIKINQSIKEKYTRVSGGGMIPDKVKAESDDYWIIRESLEETLADIDMGYCKTVEDVRKRCQLHYDGILAWETLKAFGFGKTSAEKTKDRIKELERERDQTNKEIEDLENRLKNWSGDEREMEKIKDQINDINNRINRL